MRKVIQIYELPAYPGMTLNIKEKVIEVLTVQYYQGKPVVWVLINPDEEDESGTEIISYETGQEILDEKYIGTLQDYAKNVWHYFIVPERSKVLKTYDTTNTFDEFAALAQSFGKIGVSAEQATQAFDMTGLFDACM